MIKEKDQIQRFFRIRRFFNLNEVVVFPQSADTLHLVDTIFKEENWHLWTDSSGNGDPPPDFYSNHYKIMMDMMEIYDDEKKKGVNSKIRERKYERMIIGHRSSPEDLKLVCNILPDKANNIYHDYKSYIKHFERVVNEHIESIKLYQKNHPGFKTLFFLWDESISYFKTNAEGKPVDIHRCFEDKRFVNLFLSNGIDYVFWFTPYKKSNYDNEYPLMAFYDVEKTDINECIDYDTSSIICAEKQ